ncbi:hypothetical protein CCR87_08190 [Rhodobaculum claviforme]|uniref:Integrase catalytic domain-containing protein n=1 Tax=Rhodobaculum claviforme TaxID=1549854 RepID=A0A934TKJ6_9RHOB|nr:hypothetical protein [Rhodobaculum claviforme]
MAATDQVPDDQTKLLPRRHPYMVRETVARGIQFAEQPRNRYTITSREMRFDMICEANGIEHRLTKPNHPWTNGQVERMNRTIKEATVKRFVSIRWEPRSGGLDAGCGGGPVPREQFGQA